MAPTLLEQNRHTMLIRIVGLTVIPTPMHFIVAYRRQFFLITVFYTASTGNWRYMFESKLL